MEQETLLDMLQTRQHFSWLIKATLFGDDTKMLVIIPFCIEKLCAHKYGNYVKFE